MCDNHLAITITIFGIIHGSFYSLTLFLGVLPTPKWGPSIVFLTQQRNVCRCQPFTSHLHIRYRSLSKSLPSICITSVKLSAPLQALQYQYLSTLQNAVCAKVQCSIRCNTRCKSTDWKRSLCFEVQFVHNDNAIHCPEQWASSTKLCALAHNISVQNVSAKAQ